MVWMHSKNFNSVLETRSGVFLCSISYQVSDVDRNVQVAYQHNLKTDGTENLRLSGLMSDYSYTVGQWSESQSYEWSGDIVPQR